MGEDLIFQTATTLAVMLLLLQGSVLSNFKLWSLNQSCYLYTTVLKLRLICSTDCTPFHCQTIWITRAMRTMWIDLCTLDRYMNASLLFRGNDIHTLEEKGRIYVLVPPP